MSLYNSHTHSGYSHDATGKIEDMIKYAISGNLSGFAVTDHCDCEYSKDREMISRIEKSYNETKLLSKKYRQQLMIAAGIEIGDALYDEFFYKKIISSFDWDVVLCSVHAVKFEKYEMPFSTIDFSAFDEDMLEAYIKKYFENLYQTALNYDYDILCHITVIFRYIKYKYNKNVEVKHYLEQIERILRVVINRNKVLEINISGYNNGYLMPDIDIIDLYLHLGGKKLSLGNDSHNAIDINKDIQKVHNLLKKHGINELYFFINRQELCYNI